ncbi:hypothetical protein G647_04179 [Cladophialophora carrionii CBS 160.54]|uniref:Apple domain-containing protein n=1 Tax=Cladophialophora carrionii CBS 160.54 TaxID=1279043 RepID=V9DD27_9EURO|nr:uncharacterized protein G647_04179 [Cladophialophora carrionii CBS 160.54]ETI24809.1 hypothetical protein G647_04179 [Cladophialophora carrionii CBS 160.54]
MFFSFQSLAILAATIPFSLAQENDGVTTASTERTFTAYATTAPTTTKTIRVTKILDTTTHTTTSRVITTSPLRFTTVVPLTYLSTLNVTSTFRATTNTFSSNFTTTEYSTINTTSTEYINVTATTGTTLLTESVVTIPTPTGFVPVQDSAGNYNYNRTSKRGAEKEEDMLLPRQDSGSSPDATFISLISIVTRLAPQTTSTVFVTSTRTSTQRPAATVTSATTSTITDIIGVPDRPVNSTVISTFTTRQNLTRAITVQAETTVATITTTQSNYTAIRTTYAACATNNLLGPRLSAGNYINRVVDNNRANVGSGTNATSSYECCTICQDATDSCDFAYFDNLATTNKCTLYRSSTAAYANATCSHTQAGFFTANRTTGNRFVVMNGPCGQLVQGNPNGASNT